MEIVRFIPSHLDTFEFERIADQFRGALFERRMLEQIALRGETWSAIAGGLVIAIAGIVPLWSGVAEVWSVMLPEARDHFKSIHRQARNVIDGFLANGGWRVQVTVLAGFEDGKRWLDHLGFKFEGFMFKYGPDGRDYERWAVTR